MRRFSESENTMMVKRWLPIPIGAVAFCLSFASGVAIWVISRAVTDEPEAWDSGGPSFVAAMVGVGLICGAIAPRNLWLAWAGMYLGQFVVMLLTLPLGPLAHSACFSSCRFIPY